MERIWKDMYAEAKKALNPRKIMTRAAVELTVTPYCAAQLTACGDVTQRAENGIETLCETQEVSIIKALRSKDFVFSDDLVLSSSKEPAAELLRETELSIAAVAEAVGYDSAGKFSSAFRERYHLLPSEYRKAQK